MPLPIKSMLVKAVQEKIEATFSGGQKLVMASIVTRPNGILKLLAGRLYRRALVVLHVEEPPPVRKVGHYTTDQGTKNEGHGQGGSDHGANEARSMLWSDFHETDLGQTIEAGCANALKGTANDAEAANQSSSSMSREGSIQSDHVLCRGAS